MSREVAILGITERCNHRCIFCLDTAQRRDPDMPFAEVVATLESIAQRGVRKAIFMTGETALRPDFLDILDAMRDLGIEPTLTTNGAVLANPEHLDLFLRHGLHAFNISIHSVDDAVASRLSGRAWTRDRQRAALANLERASGTWPLVVNLRTVLMRDNVGHLPEIADEAWRALPGVENLTLTLKQMVPMAASHDDLLVPFDEARPYLAAACRHIAGRQRRAILDGFPLCAVPGHEHWTREVLDLVEATAYVEVHGCGPDSEASRNRLYRKRPECAGCRLDPICFGANGRVLAATGEALHPSQVDPAGVLAQCWPPGSPEPVGEGRLDPASFRPVTRVPSLDEAPMPQAQRETDGALDRLAAALRGGVAVAGLHATEVRVAVDRLEADLEGPAGTVTAWVACAQGEGACLVRTTSHRLGYVGSSGLDPVPVVRALAAMLRTIETT